MRNSARSRHSTGVSFEFHELRMLELATDFGATNVLCRFIQNLPLIVYWFLMHTLILCLDVALPSWVQAYDPGHSSRATPQKKMGEIRGTDQSDHLPLVGS